MSKISHAILLVIILIILTFPINNNAEDEDQLNQLSVKKVRDIKLASPTVVQTNKLPSLKQIKKPNLLKSVALATMLATGIMVKYRK
jgi:hypothetical protein